MKVLKKVFFLGCLLGGIYSQAMGAADPDIQLIADIEQGYKKFQSCKVPGISKPVQYLCYLQENADKIENAAKKIALIIATGAGVGGMGERKATPTERALMVRGINFAVRKKVQKAEFNLMLLGSDAHSNGHQSMVDRLIDRSQEIQKLSLNNVEKNPNYDGFYPQAPVFHPYNALSHPFMFSVATKLGFSVAREFLPVDIRDSVSALSDENLDLFFIAQQKIPGDEINTTLFRPHYWVSPNGERWQNNVWARFSKAPYGNTLTKDEETTQDVHVHDSVSSPDNFSVEQILPTPSGSLAFWSLCRNPVNDRHALTLHWILEGDDPQNLWNIVADLSDKTLGGLSDRIAAHHSLRKLYNFAF